jgi:integrase
VVLRRPIGHVVAATLGAAAKNSEHTARAYQTAMGLFMRFLESERGHQVPPEWQPFAEAGKGGESGRKTVWSWRPPAAVLRLVDAALLDGFAVLRSAEGDSINTIAARLGAVRTFLSVAYRDGILTHDQARSMGIEPYKARQKRDEKPVGRRLSPAEVRKLRKSVDASTTKGKRDRAILDCMLYAGLRRSEVAGLDMGNFHQDGGRWWLILEGKGGQTRRIKVHDTLYKNLAAWMDAAGLAWHLSGRPVFLSVNKGDAASNRPINAGVVGRLVAEYGARANLAPLAGEHRLSAHDLRRTFARNAYDNGAPLMKVQAILGHSDPKTTARYIGSHEDDDQTAVDFVRY